MSQQELLSRVVAFFESHDIGYLLTGSLASSYLGEPRQTHDIDVVFEFQGEANAFVSALIEAFPEPDFYLSADAVKDAIRHRRMFNLIQTIDGDKVDFWLLTDEPFDRARFDRRTPVDINGIAIMMSTPEDTILMKLRWSKEYGGSEKQQQDVLSVYEVQHQHLDQAYLDRWAEALGLTDALDWIRRNAEPM